MGSSAPPQLPLDVSLVYSRGDYLGLIDTEYRRYGYFSDRADLLNERWAGRPRVLVAGCGWGYLVDELCARGVDAWGCDASRYATLIAAPREVPDVAHRVLYGDITLEKTMRTVGSMGFDHVVTENVLPCLTVDELPVALSILRSMGEVLHIVTPRRPGRRQSSRFTWLDADVWREMLHPDDVLFTGRA